MRKLLPPDYFIALLILVFIVHFAYPGMKVFRYPFAFIGIIFVVLGIAINIWADQIFKKKKTTVKPHELPSVFETQGPYSFSRHPMYFGMACILFGTAILLGSITSLIPAVIFVILMELLFIPTEENNMLKQFGHTYRKYKRKVRRWF